MGISSFQIYRARRKCFFFFHVWWIQQHRVWNLSCWIVNFMCRSSHRPILRIEENVKKFIWVFGLIKKFELKQLNEYGSSHSQRCGDRDILDSVAFENGILYYFYAWICVLQHTFVIMQIQQLPFHPAPHQTELNNNIPGLGWEYCWKRFYNDVRLFDGFTHYRLRFPHYFTLLECWVSSTFFLICLC